MTVLRLRCAICGQHYHGDSEPPHYGCRDDGSGITDHTGAHLWGPYADPATQPMEVPYDPMIGQTAAEMMANREPATRTQWLQERAKELADVLARKTARGDFNVTAWTEELLSILGELEPKPELPVSYSDVYGTPPNPGIGVQVYSHGDPQPSIRRK